MKHFVQPFPRTAPAHEQECQSCADLQAENDQLRERIATVASNYLRLRSRLRRVYEALQRDSHFMDKRTPSHDRETWERLSNGRPAGRSGDVK